MNKMFVEAVKEVRAGLGLSLREAHDFVFREPANWQSRFEESKTELTRPGGYRAHEERIREVLKAHATAQGMTDAEALAQIKLILGM